MTTVLWIVSALLLAVCLVFSTVNCFLLVGLLRGRKVGSFIPLVGGLAGAIGVAALPIASIWVWFWVPLLSDVGCVLLMAWAGVSVLPRRAGKMKEDEREPE